MKSPMGTRQPLPQTAQSLLNGLVTVAATVAGRESTEGFLSPRPTPVASGRKVAPILNPIWRSPSLGASQPNGTAVAPDSCCEDVSSVSVHRQVPIWDLDLFYLSMMLLPVLLFMDLLMPHLLS